MGYRSSIIFGITKVAYTKAFLKGNIPKLLTSVDCIENKDTDTAKYWIITDWKWDVTSPYETEFYTWIDTIEKEYMYPRTGENQSAYEQIQYGFIRMGDDHEDTEFLGDPWEFNIEYHRNITCPVADIY